MKRLAVLGHPVAHSRSPAMQTAALAELGLGEEWSYEAIDVAPDGFERLVRELPGRGFVGANVTVPHKGAALAVADTLTETAREIGAANTLSFDGDEIRAGNTDAGGLLAALPASPAGGRALVLGAGGAARAVVWALLREGAAVDVWNRTSLRSSNLCEELGGSAIEEPDAAVYDLIVNSTAVGLHGEDPFEALPLEPRGLRPRPGRRRHGLRPRADRAAGGRRGGGGDDRGRDRGPRPAGGALAAGLDRPRGAARRDARRRPRLTPPAASPGRVYHPRRDGERVCLQRETLCCVVAARRDVSGRRARSGRLERGRGGRHLLRIAQRGR